MKYFSATLLLFIFLPLSAEAVVMKDVKKPTTIRKVQIEKGDYNKRSKYDVQRQEAEEKVFLKKIKDVPYTHLATGISIKHPYNWEIYEFPKNKGFSVSPAGDSSRELMYVSVDPIPNKKDMTVEELEKWFMNKSTISNSNLLSDWYIPSFKLISSDDATLFGKSARKFTYTGEFQSVKYLSIQYLTSFDQKMYSIRFMVLPGVSDAALANFEKLFESLKLKPVKVEATPKGKTRK